MSPVDSAKIKGSFFFERDGYTEIFGCSWGYKKRFDGCAAVESKALFSDWAQQRVTDPKITRVIPEWSDSGSVFIGNAIQIKAKRQGPDFKASRMFYKLVINETEQQTEII
jgi:hypothetical protein